MAPRVKTTKAAAGKAGPTLKIKDILLAAISENANGRYGCSFTAIKKYLREEYQQNSLSVIKRIMKSALSKGEIVPVKAGSVGLRGSFKLPPAAKVRAVKKSAPKKVAKAPAKKSVAPKRITTKPKVEKAEEDKENSTKSEAPAVPLSDAVPPKAKRAPKKKALKEANTVDNDSGETAVKKQRKGPAIAKIHSEDNLAPQTKPKKAKIPELPLTKAKATERAPKSEAYGSEQSNKESASVSSKAKRAPKKKALKEANSVDNNSEETAVKKQRQAQPIAKKPSQENQPEAHASEQGDRESAMENAFNDLMATKKPRRDTSI